MPGKSYRNNFTSGVLDSKLGARSDLEQWRTGLKTGTNIFLLPHGGVKRRPGIRFTKGSYSEKGRMGRFRFSKDQQYLLRFGNSTVEIWDSVSSPPVYVTSMPSPYSVDKIDNIYTKAQLADTAIFFHPSVAPHKFFRQTCDSNALETCGSANKIRVRLAQHDLVSSDTIAISGATAFAGYEASSLNVALTGITVPSGTTTAGGTSTETADLCWKKTKTVEINVDHAAGVDSKGFKIGDSIELSGFGALPGIPSDQINRRQIISDIRGRITITAGVAATSIQIAGNSGVELSYTGTVQTIRTVSGSSEVYVGIPSAFTGMLVGKTITISSASTTGGIVSGNINGTQTVTWVSGDGKVVRFNATTPATSSATSTATVKVAVTLNENAFSTTSGSSSLVVDVPAWFAAGVQTGTSVTVSGLSVTVGGIAIASINGSRNITVKTNGGSRLQFAVNSDGSAGYLTQSGTWKADGFFEAACSVNPNGNTTTSPVSVTSGSSLVDVYIQKGSYPQGFIAGDYITFAGLTTVGTITAAMLNATHKVLSVADQSPNQIITIDVGSATASSTTTGSSAGTWSSPSQTGGGSAIRVWSFTSLDPASGRKGCLKNIPQFDFADKYSPQPRSERQRLEFQGFTAGDIYSLTINMSGVLANGRIIESGPTVSIRASKIVWNADVNVNATLMQTAINNASSDKNVVTVTYDTDSVGGVYGYFLQFANARPIDLVQIEDVKSANGVVSATQLVEGGSTQEDMISTTRGWPSGGIFFQRRLWMFGLPSRPATICASQTEDFFNFDIGEGLDSEAIVVTGDFDPIKHLMAERGLFMLTEGSEVQISGAGDNAAITPGNINLQVASRYGSTSVTPLAISGRPIYVDSVARNIRQFGASADSNNAVESKEISILSQFLISNPVRMDVWRNSDGDYVFVVNSDGTAAVLNINLDQQVVGWTKCTTNGLFTDVCQSGEKLFVEVNRSGTRYWGYFDYTIYTDMASVQSTSGDTTLAVQLANQQVQVRCDSKTLDTQTASAVYGNILLRRGGVTYTPSVTSAETGLAIPVPTVIPMAPQVDQYSGISKANVDLYESKEVYVNGYRLRDTLLTASATSDTPITGFRPIQLRGYGDRISVTVTAPNPQPMHIRAIEMEIV